MIQHRLAIGIKYNDRMFKLFSLSGIVIDDILSLRGTDKRYGKSFFTKISMPSLKEKQESLVITDDNNQNNLTITPGEIVFRKTSPNDDAALNLDKFLEDFIPLWKVVNKTLSLPPARMIGLVGEFRIKIGEADHPAFHLLNNLTKFNFSQDSGSFKLHFDQREPNSDSPIDPKTSDFWNKIYSFYNSDMDETPISGHVNANLDLQRYFNPAKLDPLKEITLMKNRFNAEKKIMRNALNSIGLI